MEAQRKRRVNNRHAPDCGTRGNFSHVARYQRVVVFRPLYFRLANSIRRDARCIAGREVVYKNGQRYASSHWIRPVSNHGKGEISLQESRLSNAEQPCIFDIVRIPFDACENNVAQPENHIITPHVAWEKTSTFPAHMVHILEETPENLWFEARQHPDRISHYSLTSDSPVHSLYLIEVETFTLELYSEENPWQDYPKRRRRVLFTYNGHHYDLPITDPIFGNRYCQHIPDVGEEKHVQVFVNSPYYFCVSLSAEFHDNHYKIVATIFE